jgi:hypothetical protein
VFQSGAASLHARPVWHSFAVEPFFSMAADALLCL